MAVFFLMFFCGPGAGAAADTQPPSESQSAPVDFFDDMTVYMKHEAVQVSHDLKHQARSLFEHTPLGWNSDTLANAFQQVLLLPSRLPQLISDILEQSRVLGVAGSIIMLVFLIAVGYSLIGRKRVLARAEASVKPLIEKMPEEIRPYFFLILVSITAALIPLILLGFFYLVKSVISYDAPWFSLIGNFLGLWSIGALLINSIRGIVDRGILEIRTEHGGTTIRLLKMVIFYILIGIAVIWGTEAFSIRKDFLALLKFIIFLSFVIALSLFFIRKKLVLSLLPQLPYPSYQLFIKGLERFYYPVIGLTFLTGILWCIGFRHFCAVLWEKTWAVAGVYIGFSVAYHLLMTRLQKWSGSVDTFDETVQTLIQSLKKLILYSTIVISACVIMDMLEILDPTRQLLSFPLVKIGSSVLSVWILIKSALALLVFFYGTRLLCAYLDFKLFPYFGVESGLAYAINTFLRNFLYFIGGLVFLEFLGVDFRAILVFAGAIGVGIGLALQNLASNLISGLVIIFGGKIRKGDWLEVSGALGIVTDIHFYSTKLKTRDDVEYLIPNSQILSNTIVNYSLSSPMVRISVPFGVSYSGDPKEVVRVITPVAEKEPMVIANRKPEVQFVGYGDNSINFELLIWIDIRRIAPQQMRSRLYFSMFDALKNAGIEIPFPQRDLHIRSFSTDN